MHRSRRALAAAVTVSISLGASVAVAHADSAPVLYVNNNTGSNCTDTGSGAGGTATPFCTIQAAANAALPGDTVQIESGVYRGAVNVTVSGTATAPIVFDTSGGTVQILNAVGVPGAAFSVTGASYIEIEGSVGTGVFDSQLLAVQGVAVNASSHITVDSVTTQGDEEGVEVTGTSSDVTVTRSYLSGATAGVLVTPGSSGDVISTNEVINGSEGIDVEGSTDTLVTSNSVFGNTVPDPEGLIWISDGATGTTIENNVLEHLVCEIFDVCPECYAA